MNHNIKHEKASLVCYELGYNICEDQQICYEPRY